MALQAQLQVQLPLSSPNRPGSDPNNPSPLSYAFGSGSNLHTRNSLPRYSSRETTSHATDGLASGGQTTLPASTSAEWTLATTHQRAGSVYEPALITNGQSHNNTALNEMPSQLATSMSLDMLDEQPNSTVQLASLRVASGSQAVDTAYPLRLRQAQSQEFGSAGYKATSFATPPADSGAGQAPALLHPDSNLRSLPSRTAMKRSSQSLASASASSLPSSGAGSCSTRTSIASNSSAATTPLTPITPITPETTSACYSQCLLAPSSDAPSGTLPMRAPVSVPAPSHQLKMQDSYINLPMELKARVHSVSLPTPYMATGNAQGLSGIGQRENASSFGPTSAPTPMRHFSLPSLPHDYHSSGSYLASPNQRVSADDQTAANGYSRPNNTCGTDAFAANQRGTFPRQVNDDLNQPADLELDWSSQRGHASSRHLQMPLDMPSYGSGSSVLGSHIGYNANMNMDFRMNGSGSLTTGTSATSAAAAAAAAMAMGSGHAAASVRGAPAASANTGTTKKHKCKVCDKRFTRPSSLQTHMYSHTGEKPFTCDYANCGRQFSVVSNLRRHKKVHKGAGPPGGPHSTAGAGAAAR